MTYIFASVYSSSTVPMSLVFPCIKVGYLSETMVLWGCYSFCCYDRNLFLMT